ncbi:MAG: hypothetical protein LBL90_07115 [Prevotellaceae bacterium]|nr:hypothetical protein [Prevotellaceae bacterium]
MKRINLILAGMLLCAGLYGQELIKFSENGKYGFCDAEGNVLVRVRNTIGSMIFQKAWLW